MTLAELTTCICTKTGQTDEASAAACRLFLRRRYATIWDHALWQESLSVVTLTASESNICTLPAPADRIVAVRQGNAALPVLDQTTLMRYDSGSYDNSGVTVGFTMESPSCLLLPADPAGELFTLASDNPADTTQTLTVSGHGVTAALSEPPRSVRETIPLRGVVPVSTNTSYTNVVSAGLSSPCAGELTLRNSAGAVAARLAPGELNFVQRPRFRVFGTAAEQTYAVLFNARASISSTTTVNPKCAPPATRSSPLPPATCSSGSGSMPRRS